MQTVLDPRQEAGRFLRSRRERLLPAAVGLPDTERRRVPGLRRDELARLAGVSVEYYTRLEQGRGGHPSESVTRAVATALRLDDAETQYVFELLRPRAVPRARRRTEHVRPALAAMVDALGCPALVLGRRTDVLAWNRGAALLLVDFGTRPPGERNLARLVFLDDGYRALLADWETAAGKAVGVLRMAAGREPHDPDLAVLVGELTLRSPEFARRWNARDVRQKTYGTKPLNHPLLGPLEVEYETLRLPDEPEHTLVLFRERSGPSLLGLLDALGDTAS